MEIDVHATNALDPSETTLESYAALTDKLEDLSDAELVDKATEAGVDGASTMEREHLIAKLKDEPGANDI